MQGTVTGYAGTVVNQQDMAYIGKRTDWKNTANAVGHDGTTYTEAHYAKSKNTYKRPHTLSCYDFGIKLPDYAVITGITFQVKIRSVGKQKPPSPTGRYIDFHTIVKNTSDGRSNGWWKQGFVHSPAKKIPSSWAYVNYSMTDKEIKTFNKYNTGNPAEIICKDRFGIMLYPFDLDYDVYLQIAWVKLIVDYEIPSTYIHYETVSINEDMPTHAYIGETQKVTVEFGNTSKVANLPDQVLNVKLPYGFTIDNWHDGYGSQGFDEEYNLWYVSGKANSKSRISFDMVPHALNQKVISMGNEYVGDYDGYFYVFGNPPDDWNDGYIEHSGLQQGEKSCVSGYMTWISQDETANPYLQLGSVNLTETDIISVEITSNHEDVYLIDYSLQDNKVLFNIHVPSRVEVDIAVHVCYYPRQSGTITLAIPNFSKDAYVMEPIEYKLVFNEDSDGNCTNVYTLEQNRFMTQVDTDLTVIPLYFDEISSDIYVDESTLNLDQWKKRRYIGCVVPEHSHYDPDSTFEDDLLNEHYKNMQYVGKANEYDEEISLKIKLRPWQVPTIQGLIKIDRPIPINLIPSAWEGDPLNHRGWAEITKIKAEETNPLWHDCEIDVKYITHNIISRFNIARGNPVNSNPLPAVYQTSLSSGEDIGEFFDVQTDGAYVFDDDEEKVHRNLFSISNQQSVVLTSKKPLSSKSIVDFYWDTTLFSELRENNISRVIQLIDEADNVVFEYEHCNFEFDDDIYTCDVIGRVSNENGFVPEINQSNVYIHSDFEFTDDRSDEDYDDEDIDVYGSQTRFTLDSNQLTVRELGFSGNEFEKTITLETGSYYFRSIITNKNNDADTGNILTWIDCSISELAFNSALSKYYNSLVVSPYPVPNKTIVFTRECAEGTIYFLEDDGGDFKFILEPFYQYLCGVDLVTDSGISVFDFNNSYTVIYLTNGLIRFGINRVNGDLYLDKWDYETKSYIRTNRFRITRFDDVEVVTINDDVITLEVAGIYITMWRGRPYVAIKHPDDDIEMLDTFTKAFADGIGDENYAYPQTWLLSNSKNKLPECVGGTNLIKSSCMELTVDNTELDDLGDFLIAPSKTECEEGEEVILTIQNNNIGEGEVSLVINDEVVGTNVGNTITATLTQEGLNTIYAVYHGDDTHEMELSNVVNVAVSKTSHDEYEGVYLSGVQLESYTYNQDYFEFLLTKDTKPYPNIPVDVYTPSNTWHLVSGSDGLIKGAWNRNIPAGTHTITAEAIDDDVILATARMKVKVVEAKSVIEGRVLSLKAGGKAKFRLVDGAGQPIQSATVTVNVGGKTYSRTTNKITADTTGGYFNVKLSKKGTYNATVKYAGEKKKYKAVSKKFSIEVK